LRISIQMHLQNRLEHIRMIARIARELVLYEIDFRAHKCVASSATSRQLLPERSHEARREAVVRSPRLNPIRSRCADDDLRSLVQARKRDLVRRGSAAAAVQHRGIAGAERNNASCQVA